MPLIVETVQLDGKQPARHSHKVIPVSMHSDIPAITDNHLPHQRTGECLQQPQVKAMQHINQKKLDRDANSWIVQRVAVFRSGFAGGPPTSSHNGELSHVVEAAPCIHDSEARLQTIIREQAVFWQVRT
jgi:hypothetical protein